MASDSPNRFKIRNRTVTSNVPPCNGQVGVLWIYVISQHLAKLLSDQDLQLSCEWRSFECDIVGVIEHRREIAEDCRQALVRRHVRTVARRVERDGVFAETDEELAERILQLLRLFFESIGVSYALCDEVLHRIARQTNEDVHYRQTTRTASLGKYAFLAVSWP